MKSGVPNWAAVDLSPQWCERLRQNNLDERIVEIKAINLANHYNRWYVPRLGSMPQKWPDGVFQILGGQLNSATLAETWTCKMGDIVCMINKWEIQEGAQLEVGLNWGTYPLSATLLCGFGKMFKPCAHTLLITSMKR
jgi:hypothetical protein